jgi:hypothetical protein
MPHKRIRVQESLSAQTTISSPSMTDFTKPENSAAWLRAMPAIKKIEITAIVRGFMGVISRAVSDMITKPILNFPRHDLAKQSWWPRAAAFVYLSPP